MKLWMRCMALCGAGILAACFDGDPVLTESIAELDKDSEHLEELDEDLSSSSAAAEKKSSSSRSKRHSDDEEWEDDELDDDYTSTKKSSSSKKTANVENSSASAPVPGESYCAPSKQTITFGESVTWTFYPNKTDMSTAMSYLNAEYSWNFGTDTEVGTGKMVTSAITYETTGLQTASVIVTNGLESRKYDCSPLQVNRLDRAICTCTGSGGDLQMGSTVTWTANCVGSSNSKYVWNGVATDANTFTKSITVADVGEKIEPPTLTVQTADGSVFEGYTCDDIKVTDGPEFELSFDDSDSHSDKITVPSGACINVRGSWHNDIYRPRLRMFCDLRYVYEGGAMTLTYGDNEVTETGDWAVSNVTIELAEQVPVGDFVPEGPVCVTYTGGTEAQCELGLF